MSDTSDMVPRVTLDNFWLIRTYKVGGEPFTFFWGVTCISMEDAFRHVSNKPSIVEKTMIGTNEMIWYEGEAKCRLIRGAERPPDPTNGKVSVRDDQIRKPLPKQIVFNL